MIDPRHRATDLPVLVASIALLSLEVAQIRVFSYSLDPLLVYSAISVALLGLGAGSIAVAIRPTLAQGDIRQRLVVSLIGFSLATLLAHLTFARFSEGLATHGLVAALLLLSLLVLPYFFAGLFLSIVMARRALDIGRVYFFNLLGSGVGCVLVYPLLRPFGIEAIIAGCAALAALVALWLAWPLRGKARALTSAFALAALLAIPAAESLFPFQPDPRDLFGMARTALQEEAAAKGHESSPQLEYAAWDPVSRVEVYDFPGRFGKLNDRAPIRFFVQDGGAGSFLFDLRDNEDLSRTLFEGTIYGAAYMLSDEPKERVLVIGLGGAPDIFTALHHGAKEIVGVEINQSTIDVVGKAYADFIGDPYGRPNVRIIHGDGRSFVERSTERFSLIQMSGTDTLAAGASGAFMLSENYLYTKEAFDSYWERLDDDGILAIVRFLSEPARISATGVELLRSRGIEHPERHFVVLQQGISVSVLLSKRELGPSDIQRLRDRIAHANESIERLRLPLYESISFGFDTPIQLHYAPGLPAKNPYTDFFRATEKGEEKAFLASLPLDFSPVTDDRPFFFQFFTLRHLHELLGNRDALSIVGAFQLHIQYLFAIAAIAVVLIVLPLVLRRGPSAAPDQKPFFAGLRPLVYFGCIGFGYLFIELTLMQKTALFLGHPTYSIATTLLSLLVASGIGSLAASRSSLAPRRLIQIACALVIGLLLFEHFALRHLFSALLSAPFAVRIAVVAIAIAPLGFVMGIPFPLGLRITSARGEDAVAWGLGINSFASVLASLVGVPIAMFFGFAGVVAIAVVLYGAAAIVSPKEPLKIA